MKVYGEFHFNNKSSMTVLVHDDDVDGVRTLNAVRQTIANLLAGGVFFHSRDEIVNSAEVTRVHLKERRY